MVGDWLDDGSAEVARAENDSAAATDEDDDEEDGGDKEEEEDDAFLNSVASRRSPKLFLSK